jgi:transcriptional regulator with XRE-family HTH domain
MSLKAARDRLRRAALKSEFDAAEIASLAKAQVALDVRRAIESSEGMNQSTLARALRCSKQYVSQILNEETNFTIETLASIGAALRRHLVVRILADDEAVVTVQRNRVQDALRIAYAPAATIRRFGGQNVAPQDGGDFGTMLRDKMSFHWKGYGEWERDKYSNWALKRAQPPCEESWPGIIERHMQITPN